VDITWVTAEVGGQVLEVFVEPGIQVTPDTRLIQLQDPQLDRAVRDAERDVDATKAELERFKLQQESLQYDLKVAIATARANYEDAREQAEIDETMARRGLKSPRQWQFSLDRAERNQMLFEVQVDRAANSVKTQQIQLNERNDAIERAKDRRDERREQQAALVVRTGTDGILQQLGLGGNGLEVGQRIAPGAVVAKISNPNELKAVIFVSQVQARDVVVGQPATIDTRNGIVEGRVTRIDPQVVNDRVTVDVELVGELPPGARPDLSVDGLIEVARLDDVLHVRKPVYSQENGRLEVFRLHADETIASRATVEFGRGTVHSIEVTTGLQEGDQIVVSDTSRWKSFDLVRLK
jgi:HlyD family secretion protein